MFRCYTCTEHYSRSNYSMQALQPKRSGRAYIIKFALMIMIQCLSNLLKPHGQIWCSPVGEKVIRAITQVTALKPGYPDSLLSDKRSYVPLLRWRQAILIPSCLTKGRTCPYCAEARLSWCPPVWQTVIRALTALQPGYPDALLSDKRSYVSLLRRSQAIMPSCLTKGHRMRALASPDVLLCGWVGSRHQLTN